MLRKYIPNSDHVLNVELENLDPTLAYTEKPPKFLTEKPEELKNKDIPRVKVQWRNHSPDEAMWKLENETVSRYPDIAGKNTNFGDKTFLRGEICDTPHFRYTS